MTVLLNPFDAAGGYGLVEMTTSINYLPNTYGRVNELGLFTPEPISQTTAIVDIMEGVLNLLPSVPRGGPATVANRDSRYMKSFVVPHIPHNDVVTPEDLQGIRAFGSANAADPLQAVMTRKLQKVRDKHSQTLEYMRIQALKGVLKDGAGTTLVNYFTDFGVSKKSVDFVLGTDGTEVPAKCREVVRWIKKNLKGETMTGIRALVSTSFWDKFIKHPTVKEAYKYFSDAQANPLRESVGGGFKFHDVLFEEYDATFTLSTGSTEDAFAADYGVAFPMGTRETFRTHYSPANWLETVNTMGLEYYARQVTRQDGSGIDVLSQSNPLPILRRPALAVEVKTSN